MCTQVALHAEQESGSFLCGVLCAAPLGAQDESEGADGGTPRNRSAPYRARQYL